MQAFLELHCVNSSSQDNTTWVDRSTQDSFVFESEYGVVCLRRRMAYPQTFAFIEGHMLCAGYGDPTLGRTVRQQPLHGVPIGSFLDNEFLWIEVDSRLQMVTVQRDAICTLPLFVGAVDDRLSISNQFGRVASTLTPGLHADPLGVAEHLAGDEQYGRTLVKEIQILEDRGRLAWSKEVITITEPADNPLLHRAYKDHPSNPHDFVECFETVIDSYAERYFGNGPIACELSGGFDSTALAGYLADTNHQVLAGTLRFPGTFGHTQDAKLADFKKRFKATHYQVNMDPANHFPLVAWMQAGMKEPFYHREELYQASIGALVQHFVASGVTAVISGVGGDELCQNLPPEHSIGRDTAALKRRLQQELPSFMTKEFTDFYVRSHEGRTNPRQAVPLVAYSVMSGHASGSNQYIERGLWPVYPLADPRLFNYCQGLPIQYRVNKNILKTYLEARRFPRSIATGTKRDQEHFGVFFDQAVADNLGPIIEQVMHTSILARHGLLDADKLISDFYAASKGASSTKSYTGDRVLFEVFSVLSTEINLQLLGLHNMT